MVAVLAVDYPASLVVSGVVSFSIATAAIPAVLIVTRISTAALERQQGTLQAQRASSAGLGSALPPSGDSHA